MIALTILLFALNFLDLALTIRGIQGGVAKEANPILAWCMARIGLGPTLALKMVLAVGVTLIAYQSGSLWITLAAVAGYSGLCWHNWRIVRV